MTDAAFWIREAETLEAKDPRSKLAESFRRIAAKSGGLYLPPPVPAGRERALPPERDEDRQARLDLGPGADG